MGFQDGSPSSGEHCGEVRSAQGEFTDPVGIDVDNLPGSVHLVHPIKQAHGRVMSGNDPYFTLQKAIPLNDGASVIFNTSVVASKGTENVGVYAATKSAVRSFARTAATIRAPQSSSSSLVQSIPAQHLVGVHVLVRHAPSSSGSWRLSAYQTFFASAFIEPSNRAGKSTARALRSLAVVI